MFPDNELETALQAANGAGGDLRDWVAGLLAATVWVPVTRTEDGGGHFHVLEHEGESLVPVFTSEEQLLEAQPATDRVVLAVPDLLAGLPGGVGLAVNPGGALGLPLPRAVIAEIGAGAGAGGDGREQVAPGTRVHLGHPAQEPTTLLAAVADSVRDRAPAVREASRVWAVVGERPPGLVVVAALDPDTPEERERALAAVSSVSGAAGFAVDVSFAADGGPFVAWTRENAAPFFVR